MLRKILGLALLLVLLPQTYVYSVSNNIISGNISADTLKTKREQTDTIVSENKKGFIQKILNYFEDSNKEKKEKKFDVSFIGGPHYSSDSGFGLGLVASGLYRLEKDDLSISPSNISLFGDATTKGHYVIGIKNNTIFPKERFRIDLTAYLSYQSLKYWGIGYRNARQSEYTKYNNQTISFKLDLLAKVLPNMYVGIVTDFKNYNGDSFTDISFLNGEKRVSSYGGIGAILSYDSRDFIPNPYKGIYAKLEYIIYPSAIGNRNTITRTETTFRAYQKVWKGGILAFDAQGTFSGGSIPWNIMVTTGSSQSMRGYYEGRFRDRMFLGSQVELRQHVWRRNGVVVWAGLGNVFPKIDEIRMRKTLPTMGIGYRWEFKNRVNVRLDYGIGKGESAFYFNINEAF